MSEHPTTPELRPRRDARAGRRPSRRTVVVAAAVVVVLVVAGAATGAVLLGRERDRDAAARTAAQALAAGMAAGDLTGVPLVGDDAGTAADAFTAEVAGLDGLRPGVSVTSVERDGERATAQLAVSWDVGAGWSYTTSAQLAPRAGGGTWGADWEPSVLEPSLGAQERLVAQRTPAQRGEVLGGDGAAVVVDSPVVEVGVQPSRTTDPSGLAAQLADVLDLGDGAGASLAERITAATPDSFVSVITLRQADYDALSAQLQPLPGTVFRRSTLPLAPTAAFARALLGRVGQATQEIVDASDGRIASGDTTGVSGLQRTYDERLSGTPGTTVQAAPREGTDGEPRPLSTSDPVAGQSVQLSLDARVQNAADAALATATSNDASDEGPSAALVAVDVPTGRVLAVANTPTTGTDRALTGQYPPGSTFKAVTTTALLAAGVTPDQTVPCPATATVQGRTFQNFEGEAFGDVPFSTDFAKSCNTAFIGLSDRLSAQSLPDAAAAVGIGGGWDAALGVDAFTGDVPADDDAVARAAASIGQGTVLASPVAMAVAASTIARGSWTAPSLVLDPAPAGASTQGAEPAPDAQQLAVVRDLMRQTATSGTAAALADVPGEPVHAKTGTAEYGSGDPLPTHAWTIGFQGDVAFAVLVENGTSGGTTAVPVVEAFLRALA